MDALLDGTAEIVLTPGVEVSGTVFGPEGSPLAGVAVGKTRDGRIRDYPIVWTDEAGRYRFRHVRPGKMTLMVQERDFAPATRTFTVSADMDPVDFHVQPRRAIWGRVVAPQPADLSSRTSVTVLQRRTPAEHPFKAVLPCGATMELLAVAPHPSKGKAWWRPDGTPLAEAEKPYPGMTNNRGQYNYEFVFRFSGVQGLDERLEIVGAKGMSVQYNLKDHSGQSIPDLSVALGRLEDGQEATIRYGIAAGAWTTVSEFNLRRSSSLAQGKAGGGVIWPARPYEEDGKTVVVCVHTMVEKAARVVAMLADGQEVPPLGRSGGGVRGVQGNSYRFNVPIGQIERFEFQTRPFDQLAEFHNVSLAAGHKTDVQVKVEAAAPAAQPAGTSQARLDQKQVAADLDAERRYNLQGVKLGMLIRRLTELQIRQGEAKAALIFLQAQIEAGTVRQSAEVRRMVESDAKLNRLREEEIPLLSELENLRRKFGPEHTTVREMETRLYAVRMRINEAEQDALARAVETLKQARMTEYQQVTANLVDVREMYNEALAESRDLLGRMHRNVRPTPQTPASPPDAPGRTD